MSPVETTACLVPATATSPTTLDGETKPKPGNHTVWAYTRDLCPQTWTMLFWDWTSNPMPRSLYEHLLLPLDHDTMADLRVLYEGELDRAMEQRRSRTLAANRRAAERKLNRTMASGPGRIETEGDEDQDQSKDGKREDSSDESPDDKQPDSGGSLAGSEGEEIERPTWEQYSYCKFATGKWASPFEDTAIVRHLRRAAPDFDDTPGGHLVPLGVLEVDLTRDWDNHHVAMCYKSDHIRGKLLRREEDTLVARLPSSTFEALANPSFDGYRLLGSWLRKIGRKHYPDERFLLLKAKGQLPGEVPELNHYLEFTLALFDAAGNHSEVGGEDDFESYGGKKFGLFLNHVEDVVRLRERIWLDVHTYAGFDPGMSLVRAAKNAASALFHGILVTDADLPSPLDEPEAWTSMYGPEYGSSIWSNLCMIWDFLAGEARGDFRYSDLVKSPDEHHWRPIQLQGRGIVEGVNLDPVEGDAEAPEPPLLEDSELPPNPYDTNWNEYNQYCQVEVGR